ISSEEVLYGFSDTDRLWCQGLIQDWNLWKHDPNKAKVQKALLDALSVLSAHDEKMSVGPISRIMATDSQDYPTVNWPYGKVPVPLASSGMRRVIDIAYLAIWLFAENLKLRGELTGYWGSDSIDLKSHNLVILVDEIELHLHPRWQRTILPSLLRAIQDITETISGVRANFQVFVTTHSPFTLLSMEQHFDSESDRVFIMNAEDRRLTITNYPMNKKVDASAWLTSPVFGIRRARSLDAEHAIEMAIDYIKGSRELSYEDITELLGTALPDMDPFWTIWIFQKYIKTSQEPRQ
ncbi:MAG: ATP-binding protein, partial [Cyanobacteria bacterium HKST-UBA02]|nr:ATP-binding protein [Cyanobacteria bacterium HKST-UBA02]